MFGTKFNSIFDFCGVQIDVGVFWNDGASHGVWVIGDERCHGEAGQSDGKLLAKVVLVQQEEQEQQQKTMLKNEIAALQWQKKICQTLMNNTKPLKMLCTPSQMQQKPMW